MSLATHIHKLYLKNNYIEDEELSKMPTFHHKIFEHTFHIKVKFGFSFPLIPFFSWFVPDASFILFSMEWTKKKGEKTFHLIYHWPKPYYHSEIDDFWWDRNTFQNINSTVAMRLYQIICTFILWFCVDKLVKSNCRQYSFRWCTHLILMIFSVIIENYIFSKNW